ncbi:transcriptional regulator [Frondihabitans sp. PAMC 28766]|uniref:GAF and ANTAR domain-containing protein n=1 Tax=Frondihabitans sp. PAMC 28766 TaxID=1795630 RepID=UPI00078DA785|nr:GAF and ANTAR domain-containing protein [Frondihabitans sp. PAMC 28766]AMM22289.1 transcriptional regulator [Frondihabitans sp. PAMC 28766]
MAEGSGFPAAAAALTRATTAGADWCGPFVSSLPVSAAAVSTLGSPLGTQTVCASDDDAARWDEIQIDLGEGPCWEALRSAHPVLEPDVQHSGASVWPVALSALQKTGLGAVYAFPMIVGSIRLGAVGLYSMTPGPLSEQQIGDARALTDIVARHVFRQALSTLEKPEDNAPYEGSYSRREVHQATGMVIAQLHVAADDALLVLRGHAFSTGRSVRDIAGDVVARRLDFTTGPGTE